jgi:hypothetical protein
MTWLYPAEITPLRIRAVSPAGSMIRAETKTQPANGLSTASNWLWNFFVVSNSSYLFGVHHSDCESGHGHRTDVCQHSMGYICLLCRPQHLFDLPCRLLLFPRNQGKIPRRGMSGLAVSVVDIDIIA